MALGRLQDRQNNLNRSPAPSSVVHAAPALSERLPERVKSVPLSGPTRTARHGNLARSVGAMDQNTIGRKSHVATFASHNDESEVRQMRLLGWKHASTEAERLMRFEIARPG